MIIISALIVAVICGTYISIKIWNKPVDPISIVTTSTIELNAENEISFDNFGEENFTCTGMTYDSKDNSFWVADYGALTGEQELKPRLIEVNADLNTELRTIDLRNLVEDSFNLQGVSYDANDDSLWIATGNYIYEVNKNGEVDSKLSMGDYAKYQSNGIAVDGNDIWVLCYRKYLLRLDRQGKLVDKYNFNYQDQDQICLYDGKLYCTVGADYTGNNNFVFSFNLNTGEIENRYRVLDSHAVEGIVINDGKMYIANDGAFHKDALGYSYISEYCIK